VRLPSQFDEDVWMYVLLTRICVHMKLQVQKLLISRYHVVFHKIAVAKLNQHERRQLFFEELEERLQQRIDGRDELRHDFQKIQVGFGWELGFRLDVVGRVQVGGRGGGHDGR